MPEASLDTFRSELIDWLEANCPKSLRPDADIAASTASTAVWK